MLSHTMVIQYLGLAVGSFGTLIGAGGGFVLMPLPLLYPKERPSQLTAISLAVVFFNALSGSGAYARMKRIDYQAGWTIALATVPGAILGAVTTSLISRRLFDVIPPWLICCISRCTWPPPLPIFCWPSWPWPSPRWA